MLRFLLYGNLVISLCAGAMSWESLYFFTNHASGNKSLILFIAASTLFIYNVHWLLSLRSHHDTPRIHWTRQHRGLMSVLGIVALGMMLYTGWPLRTLWPYILPAIAITGIYTLPKTRLFDTLKLKVIAKTSVLALSWTYITTLMPVWMAGGALTDALLFFTLGRLFLVYPICLLFDHRDVEQDLREGIRTLPARISDRQLKIIFFSSIALSIIFMILSIVPDFQFPLLFARLLPCLLLALLYKRATTYRPPTTDYLLPTTNHRLPTTDLLFYGLLDSLMALSALLSMMTAF